MRAEDSSEDRPPWVNRDGAIARDRWCRWMVKTHALKSGPAAVLYCLASYADADTLTVYRVSQTTIAKGSGCVLRSANSHLATLEAAGLLKVVHQGGEKHGDVSTPAIG